MTSALEKGRPCAGTVRRMGCSSEKQSTGAATFVIHIDAKVAVNMLASSTYLRAPGGCKTYASNP